MHLIAKEIFLRAGAKYRFLKLALQLPSAPDAIYWNVKGCIIIFNHKSVPSNIDLKGNVK